MSDTSGRGRGGTVRSLKDAIERVRTAEAERSDAVIELHDAEVTRLKMLADELRPVFAEIPEDYDAFSLNIAGGVPPRLWIDITAFVVVDRDHRTYRFLKDTRLGRTVILESADIEAMADTITLYVAERIIERERAIEGDWVLRHSPGGGEEPSRRRTMSDLAGVAALVPSQSETADRRVVMGWLVAAFLGGLVIGLIALFGYAFLTGQV
jgi:hypothetical protein